MFSLLPRPLTLKNTNCNEQGYSSCGPKEYRHAAGTSFSAPQVSAAAATLFSLDPSLTPDEVSWLLERAATPATPDNGCIDCPPLGSRAGRRRPAEVPRPEDRLVLTPAFDDAARLRLLLAPHQAFTVEALLRALRGSDARGCRRRPLAGRRRG